MIKNFIITCPDCEGKSHIFLSSKPTLVFMSCPHCGTPLILDKSGASSFHEEISQAAPSEEHNDLIHELISKIAEDNYNDRTNIKNNVQTCHPGAKYKFLNSASLLINKSRKNRYISRDDVINLKIDLALSNDALEFINML